MVQKTRHQRVVPKLRPRDQWGVFLGGKTSQLVLSSKGDSPCSFEPTNHVLKYILWIQLILSKIFRALTEEAWAACR